MAIVEKPKRDVSRYLWPIAIISGLGLGGYGIYRLFVTPPMPPEVKELIDEWILEAEEATQIHRDACEAGELTDQQRALLEQLEEEMKIKELWIYSFGQTWVEKLGNEGEEFAKTIGMWIIIPAVAGVIIIYSLSFLRKHWPMFRRVLPPPNSGGTYGGNYPPPHTPLPPPPQICPKCGLEYPSPEALDTHVRTMHSVTTDPNQLRLAQGYFNQASPYLQDLVAVQAGVPGLATIPWETLAAVTLLIVVVSIGIVLSFGLPAAAAGVSGTAAFYVPGGAATVADVNAFLAAARVLAIV